MYEYYKLIEYKAVFSYACKSSVDGTKMLNFPSLILHHDDRIICRLQEFALCAAVRA